MPSQGAFIDQFVERGHQRGVRPGAKLLGALFMTSSSVGMATTFLPADETAMRPYVWLLCMTAFVAGVFLCRWRARSNTWLLDLAVAFGTVLVSCGVLLDTWSDTAASSSAVSFYVWVTLYAFYFLNFKRGMLQLAWIGACYAFVLTSTQALDPLDHFVTRMAVLAGVGPLVGLVKARIRHLVDDLEQAAELDALTRVANRRGFARLLEDAVREATLDGRGISIVVIDVDYFKIINDEHGHAVGDRVLSSVATLLADMAADSGEGSFVARTGGEEFVLVAPVDLVGAELLAELARERIDRELIDGIDLTVSCGVVSWGVHGESVDELLTRGDEALMAAKASGRNRVVVHDERVTALLPKLSARREAGREMHVAMLVTLAEVLDMRDGGTSDHSRLVGRLCEETAIRLGLDRSMVERIRIAGVLHDIGKVAIPDSLLLKPAALTDEEWALMRSHPEIGARVLASIGLRDVRSYVLHHHERIDGRGYPQGVEGADIPLGARILSAADAFEAMIAKRPYKDPMSIEDAIAELERCAGSQFDADVVRELVGVIRSGTLGDHLRRRYDSGAEQEGDSARVLDAGEDVGGELADAA